MDVEAVRAPVREHFPEKYEPLLLSFHAEQAEPKGGRVAIGDDYGTTVYCDLADGHVGSVGCRKRRLRDRFVNVGITDLGRFLPEYESARGQPAPATDPERRRAARTLRSRLLDIDASALAHPEHWWSTILEQLETGLL